MRRRPAAQGSLCRAGKQPDFQESALGGGREECGGANKPRAGSPLQGSPWGLEPGVCALAVRAGSVGLGLGDPRQTLEAVFDSAPASRAPGTLRRPRLPSPPHPHSGCSQSTALPLLPHLPLPGAPALVPQRGSPHWREVSRLWRYLLLPLTPPSSNLSSDSERLLIRQQAGR